MRQLEFASYREFGQAFVLGATNGFSCASSVLIALRICDCNSVVRSSGNR